MNHSNAYVKVVLDFVEVFWYFNPLISMDSILFFSHRLTGIPGYYLTAKEREEDLRLIDQHQSYLRSFNKRKLECEIYSPKCATFVRQLGWKDKLIISVIFHVISRYASSFVYQWLLNSLVWFGRFCKRQLSFMVVCLGFNCSYSSFWTMRRRLLIKGGKMGCKFNYYKGKEQLNVDE